MEKLTIEQGHCVTIAFPTRFTTRRIPSAEAAAHEIQSLASTLCKSAEAIHGLYMRLCDVIRQGHLSEGQIRQILTPHFPTPRISEILKVARSPQEVYDRYRAGFFGFKAALAECRGYRINTTAELNRRKIRRAAERLVLLLDGPGEIEIRGRKILVS